MLWFRRAELQGLQVTNRLENQLRGTGRLVAVRGGVPEYILCMQSGQAQDAAVRRYVRLGSPGLVYDN